MEVRHKDGIQNHEDEWVYREEDQDWAQEYFNIKTERWRGWTSKGYEEELTSEAGGISNERDILEAKREWSAVSLAADGSRGALKTDHWI